eukprot:UN4647
MAAAEGEARDLCGRWWAAVEVESAEPLLSVRIDFLVCHPARGAAEVWTCEVGEQGFFSVGWGAFPGVVFPELFVDCLDDVDCQVENCGCREAIAAARAREASAWPRAGVLHDLGKRSVFC